MSKEISTQAQVAALIRKDLKELGLKNSKVHSTSFAGGNAVDVYVYNVNPKFLEKLESRYAKYEYGHFDGMTDSYNYDNVHKDIPQVKFLMIHNERTPELIKAVESYRKNIYGITTDEQCMRERNCWLSQLDWTCFGDTKFWETFGKDFIKFQPVFKEAEFQKVTIRI